VENKRPGQFRPLVTLGGRRVGYRPAFFCQDATPELNCCEQPKWRFQPRFRPLVFCLILHQKKCFPSLFAVEIFQRQLCKSCYLSILQRKKRRKSEFLPKIFPSAVPLRPVETCSIPDILNRLS
jgi:hypothetical protein